jgi:hypothetical protein
VVRPPHCAATGIGTDDEVTQPPAVTTTATVVVPAAETLNDSVGVPWPETIVPFVTVQAYVAPAPALATEAVPDAMFGRQRLEGAVIAADEPFTTAVVVPAGLVHPFRVAMTE